MKIFNRNCNYYIENKKEIQKKNKKYFQENKQTLSIKNQEYVKERSKYDTSFRLRYLLRGRILRALKSQSTKKCFKTKDLIGCSIKFLKEHLQKTAIENGYLDFDINNYSGKEYHIDHIQPCSSFNLSKEDEQRKCFHWTNLQILTAIENISKSNKVIKNGQILL